MLINIETNLTLKEIENILSNKICHKYTFFQRNYDLGINWIKNNKNFICLFYEDGTKEKSGYQSRVKSFFYGKVIKVNKKYRIVGISCVNILFIIEMLIILGVLLYNINNFDFDAVFGVLFFFLTFLLFNLNIPKGNKEIKDYLERQFL